MSWTVCIYDGNVGTEKTYATYDEAFKAASDAWYRLTPAERRRTTDRDLGAWFYISENDESDVQVRVAYDFGRRGYEVRWTDDVRDRSMVFADYDEAREFFHDLCTAARNKGVEMVDVEADEIVFSKEEEE